MGFQKSVYRQYVQGFVGEIAADGPVRVKPGTLTAPALSTNVNRIGRAFGWSTDLPAMGGTPPVNSVTPAVGAAVIVGGANYYGILGIPKSYALFGGSNGPLSPTVDLPAGLGAELLDMGIVTLSVANGNDTTQDVVYSAQLYYCIAAGAAASGYAATSASDVGRLYVFTDASNKTPSSTKWLPVPGGIVTTVVTGVASVTPNGTDNLDAGNVTVRAQLTR